MVPGGAVEKSAGDRPSRGKLVPVPRSKVTMRLGALIVVAAVLGACQQARTFRSVNAPRYAATRADAVQVLDAIPPDAIVLGDVEAPDDGWLGSALTRAKEGAAEMGADAIVVEARGHELRPGLSFGAQQEVIRVKALRVER